MEKKKSAMKKFFGEFKKFITRGNVLDMAVGVIVGSAFTAIVNALSDHILRPVINWLLALILGKDALSDVYTFLVRGYDENGVLSLKNSIYIDWGAFLNAIINFLLIAFVLFCIVRAINKVAEARNKALEGYQAEWAAVKKYRKEGLSKSEAKKKYAEDLAREEAAKAEAERIAAEEAAKKAEEGAAAAAKRAEEEEAQKRETNRLLAEIRDLLRKEN